MARNPAAPRCKGPPWEPPMDEIEVEVSAADGVVSPVAAERIERAVHHALRAEKVLRAEISVALLGDAEIAALNENYLSHEGPTDVISFELHQSGESPLGDLYIGVDQAVRQAAAYGCTPDEEILRLAVHGTLHVLGYQHPEGEDRIESAMFIRQEALLAEFLAAEARV